MFKKFFLVSFVTALYGCGAGVAAGDGLTFKELKDWNYLGRSDPEFLESFKRQNKVELEIWPIDPRKLPVQSYRNLRYIDPTVDCPAIGCPDVNSSDFRDYYRPFCNESDACRRFLYFKDGKGNYREVFSEPFWPQDRVGRIPLRISEQEQDGLPLCIELAGIDFFYQRQHQLPDIDTKKNKFIFRYCYNGKFYEVNKVYSVPIKGE